MSLLLDTHALLWWMRGEPIDPEVMHRISDPDVRVVVSAASVWEVAIKRALGKLRFERSMIEAIETSGFESLSISSLHAERAGDLPLHHRDPFDRMLIAQAQVESLMLVTRDAQLSAYDVQLLAC